MKRSLLTRLLDEPGDPVFYWTLVPFLPRWPRVLLLGFPGTCRSGFVLFFCLLRRRLQQGDPHYVKSRVQRTGLSNFKYFSRHAR